MSEENDGDKRDTTIVDTIIMALLAIGFLGALALIGQQSTPAPDHKPATIFQMLGVKKTTPQHFRSDLQSEERAPARVPFSLFTIQIQKKSFIS